MEDLVLLEVKGVNAGYGFLQVLWDVSLNVDVRECVCLIGPNGSGKSTTLKTIAGFLAPKSGEIYYDGRPVGGLSGEIMCRMGISYISEELNLFTAMTVHENLEMGAYKLRDKIQKRNNLHFVIELFPVLGERRSQLAGTLSGGERKMLAIARGMMSGLSLFLVDEPSLGLAPQLTEMVFESLNTLNKNGTTILLVEQRVTDALQAAGRGYVIEKGKIVLEGPSSKLASNEHVKKVYMGV